MLARRTILKGAIAAAGMPLLSGVFAGARADVNTRPIPSSGEQLPVIGMGSWKTFDVGGDKAELARLTEVLQVFFDNGGALIDSSPMYGNAEAVLGDVLQNVTGKDALFAATKVWTEGKQQGIDDMHRSMRRMRVARFDLMQIHNLKDWRTHIETLKAWKAEGKIRYIGVTTSHGRHHDDLIAALKAETFDFVQFTYNIAGREAEKRLLPLAQDRGIATLINLPFDRAELFRKVRGEPLPDWAAEIDCTSWAQFFLKFCLAHPAVTCLIPATSKPHHMADNMGAGFGRIPDEEMKRRMIEHLQSI
jgi:diketogulonate reductase-like aldo/keto reductase